MKSTDIPLLWGTKRVDVAVRRTIVKKFIDQGHSRAEAERRMNIFIFQKYVRYMIDVKKTSVEHLHTAINETLVEEVQES